MQKQNLTVKRARRTVPDYAAFLWRHSVLVVVLALIALILLGAFAVYLFERHSNPEITRYGDALWLTVVTMATVGYGDKVPVTVGGKIIAMLAMMFGIGILGAFISQKATQRFNRSRRRMRGLDIKVRGHDFLLIGGWNSRAPFVLSRLKQMLAEDWGGIVLLCEAEEKPVDDDSILFVHGSPAREEDLKRVKIERARAVILLAEQNGVADGEETDARTVLATLAIRSLNPQARITAEASQPTNVQHLKLAGASEVINTDLLLGEILARSTLQSDLLMMITEMASSGMGRFLTMVPVAGEMTGMTALDLRSYVRETLGAEPVAARTAERLVPFDEKYRPSAEDLLLAVRISAAAGGAIRKDS